MTEILFKVLIICTVSALLCVIFKQEKAEYSFLTALASGIIVAFLLLSRLTAPIKELNASLLKYGVDTSYFGVALKAVGIGYISSYIADICRDCGQSSLASKAEFAGKCAVFLLVCPILITIMETAVGFLK